MRERILTTKEIKVFQGQIYGYYTLHGRDFPWRRTTNPYSIVVSEVMLQQTQVERVHRKYTEFINVLPDFDTLARASQKDVLTIWQGLGYNRRALALKRIAENVVSIHGGVLPHDVRTLSSLPGIGKTTAGAILAFAFNIPSVFIETNIRRVYIHEFFDGEDDVKDADILPLVEATVDGQNPREWYWALMDYGSMLQGKVVNPNRRSAHYSRQTPFEGSDRRIRGLVLKRLLNHMPLSVEILVKETGASVDRLKLILVCLVNEGFICEDNGLYKIV
jgi:A/G-specific adenine glycosylase